MTEFSLRYFNFQTSYIRFWIFNKLGELALLDQARARWHPVYIQYTFGQNCCGAVCVVTFVRSV